MLRSAEGIADLLQGVVEHDHIIGHIRRDPHKRIAMNRLQKKQAIGDRFRNWQLNGCQFRFEI